MDTTNSPTIVYSLIDLRTTAESTKKSPKIRVVYPAVSSLFACYKTRPKPHEGCRGALDGALIERLEAAEGSDTSKW